MSEPETRCMPKIPELNRNRIYRCMVLASWLFTTGNAVSEETGERWYTKAQVNRGKSLFTLHCAECHGENGESSLWKKPGPDGLYPPPPLNGMGHTWHHQLPLLRRIIREGGTKTGGRMPAFNAQLSSDEVDSLIAGFQSFWSEDVYRKWNGEAYQRISQPQIIQELIKALE